MNGFRARVAALRREGDLFAAGRPIFIARAPGRLDLMGGNVDYTGGLVFEATIREATWAAAQLRPDARIVLVNPQMRALGWLERVEFDVASLDGDEGVRRMVQGDPAARWTAYVTGVFHCLMQHYPDAVRSGAALYLESEVPLNKGVSSSAAVEVASMKAAAAAYGIELAGVELAEACQWVENVIAASACGVMDQAAVVLGDEGCVLPLLCQPCCPRPLVRLPEELECRAIDSGVRHAVTGAEYEAARAAAFMGYKLICDWERLPVRLDTSGRIARWSDPRWNGYLSSLQPSLFRSRYEARLPEAISGAEYLRLAEVHADPFTALHEKTVYPVRAAARYAVEENHRIELFVALALGAGSPGANEDRFRLMGEMMYQSHAAYTECGLGCDATDKIVELVRREGPESGLYGAKITGGGAGGTVAVLGRKGSNEAFGRVVDGYAALRGARPHVFEGSSPGADRFGIEVVEA